MSKPTGKLKSAYETIAKMENKIKNHIAIIDKEIAWCKTNPAPENIDKESFIKGLIQAKALILKIY